MQNKIQIEVLVGRVAPAQDVSDLPDYRSPWLISALPSTMELFLKVHPLATSASIIVV